MDGGHNSIEYTVLRKTDLVTVMRKVLIITAFLFPAFALSFAFFSAAIFVIPIAFFLGGVGCWYFWRFTSLEYEYVIASGDFKLAVIYDNRARKDLLSLKIKDMIKIAPFAPEYTREFEKRVKRAEFFISAKDADDLYFFVYADKKKDLRITVFNSTERMIKIMKFYNSFGTVVKSGFKT